MPEPVPTSSPDVQILCCWSLTTPTTASVASSIPSATSASSEIVSTTPSDVLFFPAGTAGSPSCDESIGMMCFVNKKTTIAAEIIPPITAPANALIPDFLVFGGLGDCVGGALSLCLYVVSDW